MDPFLISQLVDLGIGTAQAIGTQVAYNQSGNEPRLKELKQAQGTRRLTFEGESVAGLNQEAAQMQADAQNNAIATQMAGQGASSGRDLAAQSAARMANTRAAADSARAAWTGEYRGETQEKADRQALKQEHTQRMINSITGTANTASSAAGTHYGLTDKGKAVDVDWGGDEHAEYLSGLSDDQYAALLGDLGPERIPAGATPVGSTSASYY